MTFYLDEESAYSDINGIVKNFMNVPSIMIYERTPKDESVDEVIFGIKVKPNDPKTGLMIKAIKDFHITSEKSIHYGGTKLDMVSDIPIEYVFIRTVVMG